MACHRIRLSIKDWRGMALNAPKLPANRALGCTALRSRRLIER